MSEAQYEKHCGEIESTAAWGGQAELRALSHALKRQIIVYQAAGAPIVGLLLSQTRVLLMFTAQVIGDEYSADDAVRLTWVHTAFICGCS